MSIQHLTRKCRLLLLSSIAALSFAKAAAAQYVGEAPCMDFWTALNQAATTDPSVSQARALVDEASADVVEARSTLFPQVNAFTRSGAGDTGLVDTRLDNQFGVTVSQRVFDFGVGKHARRAAYARKGAADHGFDEARLDALQNASETYLNVLRAKDRVDAAKVREDYFERHLETVQRRLARNAITRTEANRIEAEHALSRANRIHEELNHSSALSRLAILVDSRVQACSTPLEIEASFKPALPTTMEEALAMARNQSPSLKSAARTLEAERADYQQSRRAHLPIVEVQGVTSYVYDDFNNDWTVRNRIGVDLSAPIFTGNRLKAQRAQSRARIAGAQQQHDRLRRDIDEALSLAWQRMVALRELSVQRNRITQSLQEEADATEFEVLKNTKTVQHLVEIQDDLQEAILEEINTRYAMYIQQLLILTLSNRLGELAPTEF